MSAAVDAYDPLELVVDALAAYRITRLVTKDAITLPIRGTIIGVAYTWRDGSDWHRRDPEQWEQLALLGVDVPKLAELIICRWCTGVWVSFGILAARRLAPRWWPAIARALSCAAASALVAGLERD